MWELLNLDYIIYCCQPIVKYHGAKVGHNVSLNTLFTVYAIKMCIVLYSASMLILQYLSLQIITQFLRLETLLDDNVGQEIVMEVERGGQTVETTLEVCFMYFCLKVKLGMVGSPLNRLLLKQIQDLHSITPDYFLGVSGGVIHPLSYQQVLS